MSDKKQPMQLQKKARSSKFQIKKRNCTICVAKAKVLISGFRIGSNPVFFMTQLIYI